MTSCLSFRCRAITWANVVSSWINTLQQISLKSNSKYKFFFEQNASENVVCKLVAIILFRRYCLSFGLCATTRMKRRFSGLCGMYDVLILVCVPRIWENTACGGVTAIAWHSALCKLPSMAMFTSTVLYTWGVVNFSDGEHYTTAVTHTRYILYLRVSQIRTINSMERFHKNVLIFRNVWRRQNAIETFC